VRAPRSVRSPCPRAPHRRGGRGRGTAACCAGIAGRPDLRATRRARRAGAAAGAGGRAASLLAARGRAAGACGVCGAGPRHRSDPRRGHPSAAATGGRTGGDGAGGARAPRPGGRVAGDQRGARRPLPRLARPCHAPGHPARGGRTLGRRLLLRAAAPPARQRDRCDRRRQQPCPRRPRRAPDRPGRRPLARVDPHARCRRMAGRGRAAAGLTGAVAGRRYALGRSGAAPLGARGLAQRGARRRSGAAAVGVRRRALALPVQQRPAAAGRQPRLGHGLPTPLAAARTGTGAGRAAGGRPGAWARVPARQAGGVQDRPRADVVAGGGHGTHEPDGRARRPAARPAGTRARPGAVRLLAGRRG
ncbi:MAG: hypothetical protein AVDCRST_MAG45-697, partial [uncultured Solirubrobacterales bacterium]